MKDEIILHQDPKGNYTVDIVGLMYLLKTKGLPDNSEVVMIDEFDDEKVFFVEELDESSILMAEEDDSLFELDEESVLATFYIDTSAGEVIAEKSVKQKSEQFDSIHYEEALARISHGETVYLDFGVNYQMKPMNKKDQLSADMMMKGLWFTSDKVKGKKKTEKEKPKKDLKSLLQNFLETHDKEVAAANEDIPFKPSKTDEEEMEDFFKQLSKNKNYKKTQKETKDSFEQLFMEELTKLLFLEGLDIEFYDDEDDYL